MKNTEQLTLEDLAPYTPYGLNIKHHQGMWLIICGAFKKHNADDFFTYSLLNWEKDVKSTDAKPIMYPLSMLTQEIQHNGEKFVPSEKLFMWESSVDVNFITYNLAKQLIRWHFWLGDQSYFEKGLIIDKSKHENR